MKTSALKDMLAVLGHMFCIASIVLFWLFLLGVFTDKGTSRTDTPNVQTADTLSTDTSYMWLDTTHGDYTIMGKQDTFVIYTYHTNGMSALLRVPNELHDTYPSWEATKVIYQDSKGIPRAIRHSYQDYKDNPYKTYHSSEHTTWICLSRTDMDRLIERNTQQSLYLQSYYQALFDFSSSKANFRRANNPIACESMD